MNPYAQSYLPISFQMEYLFKTPFFQQRLEKFMFSQFRTESIDPRDFVILVTGQDVGNIVPIKKKIVGFLASYKGFVIVYEADRLDDPRTGFFRQLIQSP